MDRVSGIASVALKTKPPADCWGERALVAHELAHTAQYERLGGIEPFLRQYLQECLTIGYPSAPMEQEAIATADRLRDQGAA